ncbi:hypothetical protein B4N89_26285 [Embleya scabrispora]|uniref:DUF397 domain-containing protein n=1 Tax=Embleya scabrispora TaxID=159449 RepID=A0A1T3P4L5_9ACTN|nr:DUF397 domain-containing protein [Embleya scabrispora]OPC83974.1 hypothetical protein B4N89_26285 [Embleya scabrispora]
MTPVTGTNTPLTWRKSTFSGANDDCVETAPTSTTMAIRDSKDPSVGLLAVPKGSWTCLTEALKG